MRTEKKTHTHKLYERFFLESREDRFYLSSTAVISRQCREKLVDRDCKLPGRSWLSARRTGTESRSSGSDFQGDSAASLASRVSGALRAAPLRRPGNENSINGLPSRQDEGKRASLGGGSGTRTNTRRCRRAVGRGPERRHTVDSVGRRDIGISEEEVARTHTYTVGTQRAARGRQRRVRAMARRRCTPLSALSS